MLRLASARVLEGAPPWLRWMDAATCKALTISSESLPSSSSRFLERALDLRCHEEEADVRSSCPELLISCGFGYRAVLEVSLLKIVMLQLSSYLPR